jgi:hypothetical protein
LKKIGYFILLSFNLSLSNTCCLPSAARSPNSRAGDGRSGGFQGVWHALKGGVSGDSGFDLLGW